MRVRLFWLFLLVTYSSAYIQTREAKARKGNFFIYTLHSGSLFNQTVPVKWSATIKGRPALPQWLHLLPSKHAPLSYLIGTPVTTARQLTIHVIAKRTDTFASQHLYLIFSLEEDENFTKSTTQLFDLNIKNIDAEELINDRTGLIKRLERSVSDTFRGKLVNPYIFNIRSEVPMEKMLALRYEKFGSIVSIGTQKGFYPNVYTLVQNLRNNPNYCKRPNQVVINRFFAPSFLIDWCRTELKNITLLHELADMEKVDKYIVEPVHIEHDKEPPPTPPSAYYTEGASWMYFIIILFIFACVAGCVVLILTVIFFGRRQGQNHRDRNTPKDQLEQFISVREGQRHLRELSVQRQLLLMSHERDNSVVPSGIHSFLQPKSRAPTSVSGSTRFSKSASRLNEAPGPEDVTTGENVPVGKQTVKEAAKQCGSSLHLYRNPLDSESEEDNDTDSLEEKYHGH